jgi:hypothetical protein
MTQCDEPDCTNPVYEKGAITFNKCRKHYIESMSTLRPDGEYEPV